MEKRFLSALKKLTFALPAMLALATSLQASADSISYIQGGHATGTLNGVAFDSGFVINAAGDTANIAACGTGCLYNDNSFAIIYIETLGAFPFITPTSYVSSGTAVEFSLAGASGSLIDGPAAANWDMASSLGPLFGTTQLTPVNNVLTTGGALVFDSISIQSSFVASVTAVPVPAGAWLFGSGLIGLAGIARRKS